MQIIKGGEANRGIRGSWHWTVTGFLSFFFFYSDSRVPRKFAVEQLHKAKDECVWALVCPMTAGNREWTASPGTKASALATNVMSVERHGCAARGHPRAFKGFHISWGHSECANAVWVLTLFLGFPNFWSDAPNFFSWKRGGGVMCILFEICEKRLLQNGMGF